MIAKIRARYEGQTINGEQRFGYCSSVFYDLKIKQVGEQLLVKHLDDSSKDNLLKYPNFIEFLKNWKVWRIYE